MNVKPLWFTLPSLLHPPSDSWPPKLQTPVGEFVNCPIVVVDSVPQPKVVDIVSEGMCLILGDSDVAVSAAENLCEILSVTVLQSDDAEPLANRNYDVIRGEY